MRLSFKKNLYLADIVGVIMNVSIKFNHEKIVGIEVGYGPFYPPLVTSFLYYLDGILIDTGMSRMRNGVSAMLEGFSIQTIALTHHHEDHSGNAAFLSALHGASVVGHPVTVEKMKNGFTILPYQKIGSGRALPVKMDILPDRLETDHFILEPVYTPGHSRDHTCFIERNMGWLFSGDLYLSSEIRFFRSDECMEDLIQSIKKILTEDFSVLFCSHNPVLSHGKEALKRKLQYLEDFTGEVKLMAGSGMDEKEILRIKKMRGNRQVKFFTCGNLCSEHMVRSAIMVKD